MSDINELRRLAQAATPGPWRIGAMENGRVAIDGVNGSEVTGFIDPEDGHLILAAANPQVILELLDRLEAAENENAKLRIALAEKVTSEATLRDLNFGNGFINATFEGGAVQLMVDALADQFVGSGAPNYIEMQFHSEATGPLLFTLQRVDGKTPHQLRAEAEQERDALRADKATLQQMTYSLKDRLEVAESARRDDYQNWMTALDRNAELLAKFEAAEKERDALRAKITEMERQEPVAWMLNCPTLGGDAGWIMSWTQSGAGLCNRLQGEENEKRLYALPCAQPESSVPDGWKLVPTEPTPEMLCALIDGANQYDSWNEGYRDMLAAAPEVKP